MKTESMYTRYYRVVRIMKKTIGKEKLQIDGKLFLSVVSKRWEVEQGQERLLGCVLMF